MSETIQKDNPNPDPFTIYVPTPAGPQPVVVTPPTALPTGVDLGVSSISASTASSLVVPTTASMPQLAAPKVGITAEDIMVADKHDEIMQGMLDGWLKNVREQSDRIAEELRSPAYLAKREALLQSITNDQQQKSVTATEFAITNSPMYVEWVAGLSAAQRAQEINYQQNIALRVGLSEGIDNYSRKVAEGDENAISMWPIMSAALGTAVVVGENAMGSAVTVADLAKTPVLSLTGVEQMLHHSAELNAISIDSQAAMALIASLYMPNIVYQTALGNLAPTGEKTAMNGDAANRYAQRVIDLVTGSGFTDLAMTVLSKVKGAEQMTPERIRELVSVVKAVLLSSALGLIYKVQAGKITGQEFADMINGRMTVDPNKMEGKLVDLIRSCFQSLPVAEAGKLLQAISEYMDTDPAFKNIIDPGHVFEGLMNNYSPVSPLAA